MIHFECLTEEYLLKSFGIGKEKLEHHSGSGQVCIILEKGNNLTGLIDEDPTANHHPYYNKMLHFKVSEKFNLVHCHDKLTNNKMVIMKPRFEPWIIDIVHRENRRMSDFNLSDEANELHKIVPFRKGDLQKLLQFLISNNSKALLHLQSIIKN